MATKYINTEFEAVGGLNLSTIADGSALSGGETKALFLDANGDIGHRTVGSAAFSNTSAFASSSHSHAFSTITSKPTTLAGYGITDAASASDLSTTQSQLSSHTHAFSAITNKPTTVAGYGITDAVSTSTLTSYAPKASPTFTGTLTAERPVLINGANDNSGKADFAVSGGTQISLVNGQVQMGGTDMNYSSKFYYDSTYGTHIGAWDNNITIFSSGSNTGSATARDIIFKPQISGTGVATERMRIKGNGNVGIGTTSPGGILDVDGQYGDLTIGDPSIGSRITYYDTTRILLNSNEIRFYTNSLTERLRIDSSGNVGIGTTSPDQKLQVIGDISLGKYDATDFDRRVGLNSSNGAYSAGSSYIRFQELSATGTSGTTKGCNIRFYNHLYSGGTNETLTIQANGYVGIGTTAPGRPLNVESSATSIIADFKYTGAGYASIDISSTAGSARVSSVNNDLLLSPGGTERMRVLSGGNVGIGLQSPSYKLDVNGTVRATDQAYFNSNVSVTGDLKMIGTDSLIWTPNTASGYTGFWDQPNTRIALKYRNDYGGWGVRGEPANGVALKVYGTSTTTGAATFDSDVTIGGNLTVNGTTTTIDTATLQVEDHNIEIGNVTTPSNTTANNGGITLLGGTDGDKKLTWIGSNDAWVFNTNLDVQGNIKLNGVTTLDATSVYTRVRNAEGGIALYLGDSGDRGNYYDNNNHYFRNAGGGTDYAQIDSNGFRVEGNIYLAGDVTTTNQARTIDFTGFDKEGTTDFSDRAYIQHTTNTGGHTGSVLVISSQNDSTDGIAFSTNTSSNLKHNGNTIWTAGNDGAGSGLDADLLDGQQGSYYLNYNNFSNTPSIPSAANNATITLQGGGGITTTIGNFTTDQSSNETLTISHADTSSQSSINNSDGTVIQDVTLDTYGHVTGLASANLDDRYARRYEGSASNVSNSGYTTVATVSGSSLMSAIRMTVGGTANNVVVANVVDIIANHYQDIQVEALSGNYTRLYVKIISNDNDAYAIQVKTNNATAVTLYFNILALHEETVTFTSSHSYTGATLEVDCESGKVIKGTGGDDGDIKSHGIFRGNGSGLTNVDADTLDGAQPSTSASNSTIVQRTSSGYIYANYINTTANDVSSGVTRIMVETGNDNFIRHGDATAVRTYLNVENGANNYTHPTHPGDDFSVDSGPLTGATVISDIDINVTTDTLGHVTDANGTIATRTLTAANLGISAPNAPSNVSVSVVGETVSVSFDASTTSGIDSYLVYSSVDGSDYGLISIIPPDDFSATMEIIDQAFAVTGTQAYRVYAMKYGIMSSAATGSVSYTVSSAEPTDMTVIPLNNAYFVQWNPPSSNERFVTAYNVYKHEAAQVSSLARGSASLVYSGLNTNFMYQISGSNNNNYHQFWVETTIA